MQPYKPLVIDNRPTLPVFMEGSPLTDGMANFAASLFQAPLQAAEVRHQREREALGDLWQEREFDRQGQQDKLRELWHGEDTTRQKGLDASNEDYRKAQIAHLQSESARRWMEDLGKAAGSLMGHGSQAQRAGWSTFVGEDGKPYLYHRGTGQVMPATPSHSKLGADGNPIPGTDTGTTGKAGAAKAVGGFFDMRRSGAPGIARTAGDVLGLRWYGAGDEGDAPAAAPPAAAAPGLDMAEAGHHAQNIAALYQSGDRAAAQNWIQQMRAEHGEEFANAVKEQVRGLVQATPQQGPVADQAQAP